MKNLKSCILAISMSLSAMAGSASYAMDRTEDVCGEYTYHATYSGIVKVTTLEIGKDFGGVWKWFERTAPKVWIIKGVDCLDYFLSDFNKVKTAYEEK